MIIKAIRDYLTPLVPVPVFYSRIISEPDELVSVLSYPGMMPDIKHPYSYPKFQIRVRALTDDKANTVIAACFNGLQNLCHHTINGIEFIEIIALQDYYMLELDEKDRVVYQQNYSAQIYFNTANREQ